MLLGAQACKNHSQIVRRQQFRRVRIRAEKVIKSKNNIATAAANMTRNLDMRTRREQPSRDRARERVRHGDIYGRQRVTVANEWAGEQVGPPGCLLSWLSVRSSELDKQRQKANAHTHTHKRNYATLPCPQTSYTYYLHKYTSTYVILLSVHNSQLLVALYDSQPSSA